MLPPKYKSGTAVIVWGGDFHRQVFSVWWRWRIESITSFIGRLSKHELWGCYWRKSSRRSMPLSLKPHNSFGSTKRFGDTIWVYFSLQILIEFDLFLHLILLGIERVLKSFSLGHKGINNIFALEEKCCMWLRIFYLSTQMSKGHCYSLLLILSSTNGGWFGFGNLREL